MSKLTFNLVNTSNALLSDDIILLDNAFSCVLKLQVLFDSEITNNFEVVYDNDNEWITIKKNFTDNKSDNSNFIIYVEDNYTDFERYYYLSLRSNLNGEISTIIIRQPACNFRIEIDNEEIQFNSVEEEKEVKVKVYGASKSCLVDNGYVDIRFNEDIFEYDNSLFFYLEKENSTTIYDEYFLKIKFLGNYSDIKDYYYNFPIIHKDNADTKCFLKIYIKTEDVSNEIISEIVNNEFNLQNKNDNLTIKYRNNVNLSSNLETVISSFVLPTMKQKTKENIIVYKNSITDINISNNQITLQTNTYDNNENLEHNSMLLIQPKALWCHVTSEYRDNLHYINISCDDNFWGVDRKTLVVIRNAEDNNPYNKKVFVIKQNTNNKIMIKESVNS